MFIYDLIRGVSALVCPSLLYGYQAEIYKRHLFGTMACKSWEFLFYDSAFIEKQAIKSSSLVRKQDKKLYRAKK